MVWQPRIPRQHAQPRPVATTEQLRAAGEKLLEAHDPVILALRSQGRHDEARELTREKEHLRQRLTVIVRGGP